VAVNTCLESDMAVMVVASKEVVVAVVEKSVASRRA